MSHAQRQRLVALVLTSLAFVANTEAARWHWWVPLTILTVASPWLVRLVRWRTYRTIWNTSVIAVFGLLLRNVLGLGAPHLLEDGLLLAALCQVHLLNNLSDDLRPDLLYFNSFLIAVVTSFLSTDARYLCLVAVYVPLLCAALQSRWEDDSSGARERPRAWRASLVPGAAVLMLASVLFLLVPRDFDRRGLLFESWFGSQSLVGSEIGFRDEVALEQQGPARSNARIVAEIHLERGDPASVPTYWRGATMDTFDGDSWRTTFDSGIRSPWRAVNPSRFQKPGGTNIAQLRVEPKSSFSRNLFVPLEAHAVWVDHPEVFERLSVNSDETFGMRRTLGDPRQLGYQVWIAARQRRASPAPDRVEQLFYSQFDPDQLPESAQLAARECMDELGSNVPQAHRVEALRGKLEREHRYLSPGASGAAKNLEAFFAGAPAHCEYFATALALQLRSQSIPCRLVTGFHSGEWDAERQVLVLRTHHAHAWVEVLDPVAGWRIVDATPVSQEDPSARPATTTWQGLQRRFAEFWGRVTELDEGGRRAALTRVIRDGSVVAIAVMIGVLLWLRLRRRAGNAPGPAESRYRRALRRLRLDRRPAESPRELLWRVRPMLRSEDWTWLQEITEQHERSRYRPADRPSGVLTASADPASR